MRVALKGLTCELFVMFLTVTLLWPKLMVVLVHNLWIYHKPTESGWLISTLTLWHLHLLYPDKSRSSKHSSSNLFIQSLLCCRMAYKAFMMSVLQIWSHNITYKVVWTEAFWSQKCINISLHCNKPCSHLSFCKFTSFILRISTTSRLSVGSALI